jgi:hypothetical protein
LRVTRVEDLDRSTEHREGDVILSTLAFLSTSLTLPISLPYLITQPIPIHSPCKSGFQSALSCRPTTEYQPLAMALSLLRQAVARWSTPSFRLCSRTFQAYEVR